MPRLPNMLLIASCSVLHFENQLSHREGTDLRFDFLHGILPSLFISRSRNQKKITGVTISTCSRLETMPPSTGVARGFITSAPALVLHMIGSSDATTVDTVITFGRRRSSAPSVTASSNYARVSLPPSRRLRATASSR